MMAKKRSLLRRVKEGQVKESSGKGPGYDIAIKERE
jgi:hypothetical protein